MEQPQQRDQGEELSRTELYFAGWSAFRGSPKVRFPSILTYHLNWDTLRFNGANTLTLLIWGGMTRFSYHRDREIIERVIFRPWSVGQRRAFDKEKAAFLARLLAGDYILDDVPF